MNEKLSKAEEKLNELVAIFNARNAEQQRLGQEIFEQQGVVKYLKKEAEELVNPEKGENQNEHTA